MSYVYILFEKYKIEDYYSIEETVGVFSTLQSAEKAIKNLETLFKAELLQKYWAYTNSPVHTKAYWLQDKAMLEEALQRKQAGSNSWNSVKKQLDNILKNLEKDLEAEILPYDQWVNNTSAGGGIKKFDVRKYVIKKIAMDKLEDAEIVPGYEGEWDDEES